MSQGLWQLWAIAVALLFVALAGLLWPLLHEPRSTPVEARQRLRELYRSKRRELDAEALAPVEHQQALDELQLDLLQELDAPAPAPRDGPWQRRLPAALLSLALPVAALALYLQAGDPRAAATLASAPPANHGGAGEQVEAAVARLAERLRADPADLEGWLVLARSQETLERFDAAALSYRQAIAAAAARQAPAEFVARLQADLADALASARDGDLGGPAQAAIDAALALHADQPKALALAGAAALRRQDVTAARGYWRRLLSLLPPGSDMALRVEADLQRLTLPSTPAGLRARVTLAAAPPAGATVFVVVRPAGQRMPAAVLRLRADTLPADVIIDDSHSMSPERPLSRFEAVTVEARLSTSGQARAKAGDRSSAALPARPGQPQGLVLAIP